MKNSADKWIVPHYYDEFRCKADRCRHTCCHGWRIPVSFREYSRLIGMPCSCELRQRIDAAFAQPEQVSEERYRVISFDWHGNCRLLENGLCMLYTENRLDYLPRVCDLYPRSLREIGSQKLACCSSACERIVEMLAETDSLNMTTTVIDAQPLIRMDIDERSRDRIMEFQTILKDRRTTLEESIREICLKVNREQFTADYNSDGDPVAQGLTILQKLTDRQSFLYEIVEEISARYKGHSELYEQDREAFARRFERWMYIFENVINNSLIYENFPFVDSRFDDTDAYKGLCATYGLMRLVCVGYCAKHQQMEDLIDAISALFHLIEHTSFYYNANITVSNGAILLKL